MTSEEINIEARKEAKRRLSFYSRHQFSEQDMTAIGFDMFLAGTMLTSPAVSGQGMKWIKASERLPERKDNNERKDVLFRIKNDRGLQEWQKHSGWFGPNGDETVFFSSHGCYDISWAIDLIEWLDESESTPLSQKHDPFIQKHLDKIWEKLKESQIESFIKPIFRSLDKASVEHFLQTGTVNGGFEIALGKMMDGIRGWNKSEEEGEAVEFAEFIAAGNYEYSIGVKNRKEKVTWNEVEDPQFHGEDGPDEHTTIELYSLFKQRK